MSEATPIPEAEDEGAVGAEAAVEIALVEPDAAGTVDVEYVLPAEVCEEVATDAPVLELEVATVSTESREAGGTDEAPVVEAVNRLESALTQRLDALQAQFDREIRAESTREKVVDRLHAELQEYKQDLLLNTLRPVFLDLIQLHDDIGKIVASVGLPEEPVARMLDFMRGFQQGLEDILYRQGVEPFSVEGDGFEPKRQRAVATVATDQAELARRVAARLRKGFASGERVIRPEIVSVYALKREG